jgi:hypothetical protein
MSNRVSLGLPAYSSDFNPIEQRFAKLTVILRKAAAYTLKKVPPIPSNNFARQPYLVLTKSRAATVLHILPIQDMVNLNGNALSDSASTSTASAGRIGFRNQAPAGAQRP